MNLVKWTPWRDVTAFHNHVNRLFDAPFHRAGWLEDEANAANWNPSVDIYEEGDKIVIKAELPGIDKKDIAIDFKDNVLTLKGERSHDNEVKEDNYYRRERAFGKFHRAFRLSPDINANKIEADFKDGVLKIDIPKAEEAKPKKITVH